MTLFNSDADDDIPPIRQSVLRAAAALYPDEPFTRDELKDAITSADTDISEYVRRDPHDIGVTEGMLDRLADSGYLSRVGETDLGWQQYRLTDTARDIEYIHEIMDREGHLNTTLTADDIEEMDMKELRKEHPSGLVQLFKEPSMVFVIDALLELPPNREFTKTELADQAGVSTETLRKLFDKLCDLHIITEVDDTGRYTLHDRSPIVRELFGLNGAVNALRSQDDWQTALDNLDKLPDHHFSYYCPECGQRGEYTGKVPTGHVLACPGGCPDWILGNSAPPGHVIRWNTAMTDGSELRRLKRKAENHGREALTEYEQALVDCAYNDETPGPVFDDT